MNDNENTSIVIFDSSENPNISEDYEFSRDTYYELIKTGKSAVDLALEVAKSTQHPLSLQALSKLIKDVSDVTEKLTTLNQAKKQMSEPPKQESAAAPGSGTVQNNLFLGSTSDLQRLIGKDLQALIVAEEREIGPAGEEIGVERL